MRGGATALWIKKLRVRVVAAPFPFRVREVDSLSGPSDAAIKNEGPDAAGVCTAVLKATLSWQNSADIPPMLETS